MKIQNEKVLIIQLMKLFKVNDIQDLYDSVQDLWNDYESLRFQEHCEKLGIGS